MRRAASLPLRALAAGAVLLAAGSLVLAWRGVGLPALQLSSQFTQTEESASSEALIVPVAGVAPAALTDTFDDARAEGRVHDAIDIMAPRGTPVLAAGPGRVEKLFPSKDGGNTAYVRSTDRTRLYYYAHLDAYAPTLREGVMLRRGQAIGTVGATGNASPEAPHLHFAILTAAPEAKWWEAKAPINPYPLLAGR